MLQQTQVKTVIPYFKNFVKKIPDLITLSATNYRRVLKLWEGLGYYRRAQNLHKTAKILIKNIMVNFQKSSRKLKNYLELANIQLEHC